MGETICWVQVGNGFLSARPAPSSLTAVDDWKCTAVVTLTEHHHDFMESACDSLHLKWLFLPVAPISNARAGITAADLDSFKQHGRVSQWLEDGERVVVHCQGGFHRTGIFCYTVLRSAGLSSEEAMIWT